ncbi:TetR/AcrR family transcriptional regulator [Haloarchaeobius sp. DFWS5]|uniref:TetR/AcrR family transcriptional regulator n=1 Tax=Haloarchaeobius sp. DFWS5 TaxID=3446114 RepID=UPI003EC011B9
MSGGFSEVERERIKERLVEEGRDLFSHYGLKKTTIADLTEPVGIAPSTFYQFFDSKDELYFEILGREAEQLEDVLLEPLESNDDPEKAIVEFLSGLMEVYETNPLIRAVALDPQEVERLQREFPEDEAAEARQEGLNYLLPYVEEWYDAGTVDGPSPEIVANAIRSIPVLILHRDKIGPERYDETRDLVIRAFAKGLVSS